MHEVSLACRIASIAASRASKHQADSTVKSVRVRVGAWTCVNPDLLRRAFAATSEEYGWSGAKLDIEMVQPGCRCRDCGSDFAPDGFSLRCTSCGSPRVTLSQGREMEVESIEV